MYGAAYAFHSGGSAVDCDDAESSRSAAANFTRRCRLTPSVQVRGTITHADLSEAQGVDRFTIDEGRHGKVRP